MDKPYALAVITCLAVAFVPFAAKASATWHAHGRDAWQGPGWYVAHPASVVNQVMDHESSVTGYDAGPFATGSKCWSVVVAHVKKSDQYAYLCERYPTQKAFKGGYAKASYPER